MVGLNAYRLCEILVFGTVCRRNKLIMDINGVNLRIAHMSHCYCQCFYHLASGP